MKFHSNQSWYIRPQSSESYVKPLLLTCIQFASDPRIFSAELLMSRGKIMKVSFTLRNWHIGKILYYIKRHSVYLTLRKGTSIMSLAHLLIIERAGHIFGIAEDSYHICIYSLKSALRGRRTYHVGQSRICNSYTLYFHINSYWTQFLFLKPAGNGSPSGHL